jgi:S-adenosylmethionine hydrolase
MIVLMSDFGESEYVGVMKGVILSLCPTAEIVDLTHSISPQSIIEGAWVLLQTYKFFPKETVFVCVVDPGVGTTRDAVVVKTKNYTFIGPDNGLLYPATKAAGTVNVSSIVTDSDVSMTFHGRDVFARMAGLVLRNQASKMLGGFKPSLSVTLEFEQVGRKGVVVRIDRFGNIITNIPPEEKSEYVLVTDDLRWSIQWFATYSKGPDSGVFLVTGSYGSLEIATKNGSATEEIPLKVGDRITIV